MKFWTRTAKILTVLTVLLTIAGIATAGDLVINQEISEVKILKDKNGSEYVRAIIQENRQLAGVSYSAGVPVMFFGALTPQAKNLKKGDVLKAVVHGQEYKGRLSYTARAFVN